MLGAIMPNPARTSKWILFSVLSLALVFACDKKDDSKQDDKNAPEEKSDEDKEVEARLAAKKAAREAEAKAQEEKEQAVKDLASLPETLPKNLKIACSEVAKAQDEFMKKHYEGEGLERWNGAKGQEMGVIEANCVKAGSIEIAACQINAMGNAPGEYKNELPNILRACIDKFGAEAAEPG